MSLETKISTLASTIGTDVKAINAGLLTKAPLTGAGASGTWGISVNGNAATATILQTARNISIIGEVTGTTSFNGSGDVSINATISSHSHTISNVTGLQTELDSKVSMNDAMAIAIALG